MLEHGKTAISETEKLFLRTSKRKAGDTKARRAGSIKMPTLFGSWECPCSNKQAPGREQSAFLLPIKRTFIL